MTFDFISPGFIDLILVCVVIEAAALYAVFPGLRRDAEIAWTLASGAALMMALRLALSGGEKMLIAAALTAALAAHALYLRARIVATVTNLKLRK
ncbi:MAG: hypothetical protein ACK4NP_02945 [Parvularculaceae bacterium]